MTSLSDLSSEGLMIATRLFPFKSAVVAIGIRELLHVRPLEFAVWIGDFVLSRSLDEQLTGLFDDETNEDSALGNDLELLTLKDDHARFLDSLESCCSRSEIR